MYTKKEERKAKDDENTEEKENIEVIKIAR